MCIFINNKYPCGHCYECLSKVRSDWSIRLQEEFKGASSCYHAILTYRDSDLPKSKFGLATVNKKHCQDFIKRLRHSFDVHISYFLVSEYGEETQRPHYHMILFHAPLYKHDYKGRSEEMRSIIEKAWQHGFVRYDSHYLLNKDETAPLHYVTKDIYNWTDPYILNDVYNALKSKVERDSSKLKLLNNFMANTYEAFLRGGVDDRNQNFRLMSKNIGKYFLDHVEKLPEEAQFCFDEVIIPRFKDKKSLPKPENFVPVEDFYVYKPFFDSLEFDVQGILKLPVAIANYSFDYDTVLYVKDDEGKTRQQKCTFALPRYYRERLFGYGVRGLLAMQHYSRLYKKIDEYVKRYSDYDRNHEVPYYIEVARLKWLSYYKGHKDKFSERLKNRKSDNQ